MENKRKVQKMLGIVVGIVGIIVSIISIVVTVISILQTREEHKHQKNNRPSPKE